MSLYKDVAQFNTAAGHPVGDRDSLLDVRNKVLRKRLIEEEHKELQEAIDALDLEQILKESADLLYVVVGVCVNLGMDIDEAFKRVHRSNMSKADETGKFKYNSIGKVIKPSTYTPPDLSDLVKKVP